MDTPLARRPPARAAADGVLAGLAGTVVMTAFQRLVEMPLSGRSESDAPLKLVERLFPVRRRRGRSRRRLNYLAHFGVGAVWGAGHGVIQRATGLRGARAAAAVFSAQYAGDVVANTALGLYRPRKWSARDWTVDVANKLLLAGATAVAYDRLDRRS
jgi:hypothetical protein